VIAKLNNETNGVLQSPDLVAQMRELSYEPIGGTPDEASARIKADVARWTKAIHDAGIEPQ
jgi:tripartite-type tricarboxylate transporter receptor subunit TctC